MCRFFFFVFILFILLTVWILHDGICFLHGEFIAFFSVTHLTRFLTLIAWKQASFFSLRWCILHAFFSVQMAWFSFNCARFWNKLFYRFFITKRVRIFVIFLKLFFLFFTLFLIFLWCFITCSKKATFIFFPFLFFNWFFTFNCLFKRFFATSCLFKRFLTFRCLSNFFITN